MTFLLLAAGFVLLMTAARNQQSWARVAPRMRACCLRVSLAGAVVFVYLALGLLAVPAALAMVPASALTASCRRLLAGLDPGGERAAWCAVSLIFVSIVAVVIAVLRSRRATKQLRVESGVGDHESVAGFDVVTLPTTIPVAYSLGGRSRQIVLSAGLRDRLDAEGVAAVVAHEAAHVRAGHDRWLLLARLLGDALWFLPWTTSVIGALHLSLERWADEEAARDVGRGVLRTALLAAVDIGPAPAHAAGLSGAGTALAERVAMLSAGPPIDGALPRFALRSLLVAAIAAGAGFTGLATVLVALSRLCTT